MSVNATKQLLDQKIADLTAELEEIKVIRAALDNERLVGLLSGLTNGSVKRTRQPADKLTASSSESNRAKIVGFFKAHGNAWASSREIMEGADVERGVMTNVLYVANADEFESKDHPESEAPETLATKADC